MDHPFLFWRLRIRHAVFFAAQGSGFLSARSRLFQERLEVKHVERALIITALQPFQAGHDCPIAHDLMQYRFCRRYAAEIPALPCFGEHLIRQEIKVETPVFMTYAEYSHCLVELYGRTDFAGYDDDRIITVLRAAGGRLSGYHSASAGGVYYTGALSYGSVVNDGFVRDSCRLSVRDLRDNVVYSDCTFTPRITGESVLGKTYRNILFLNCRFESVVFTACTFENCHFVDCTFSSGNWNNVCFDGGSLQGNMQRTALKKVSGTLAGYALTASRVAWNNVRFDAVAVNMYAACLQSAAIRRVQLPAGITPYNCSELGSERECHVCHTRTMEAQKISSRAWLCVDCKSIKRSYSDTNREFRGKQDSLPMYSIEVETAGGGDTVQDMGLALLAFGFIATQDSTVETEYKSPRMLSTATAIPILRAMEKVALAGGMDDRCGTHIHVDCPVRDRVDHTVFVPLVEHLKLHRTSTRRFWGRYFGEYSRATVGSGSRYDAFSLRSHHTTIEYRLCKFVDFKQYLACIRFCRATTKLITDTYTYTPGPLIDTDKLGKQILDNYQNALRSF